MLAFLLLTDPRIPQISIDELQQSARHCEKK